MQVGVTKEWPRLGIGEGYDRGDSTDYVRSFGASPSGGGHVIIKEAFYISKLRDDTTRDIDEDVTGRIAVGVKIETHI